MVLETPGEQPRWTKHQTISCSKKPESSIQSKTNTRALLNKYSTLHWKILHQTNKTTMLNVQLIMEMSKLQQLSYWIWTSADQKSVCALVKKDFKSIFSLFPSHQGLGLSPLHYWLVMLPCQGETGYKRSQAPSELQRDSWPCRLRFERHFGIPPTFENMHVDPNLHPKMKMQGAKPLFDPGINHGSKFHSFRMLFLLAIKRNILEMFWKHFENKAGRLKIK